MNKPDFKIEISVNPQTLKTIEELTDELTTKISLISGTDWEETRESVNRNLGIFAKLGGITNAHRMGANRWI